MASTHRLLRALADRPEELALLLRCEYRPKQTLLHHAVAVGDAELIDTLLGFDPSLALVGLKSSAADCWIDEPPPIPLTSAIVALQPMAIRALLPYSWPPSCRGGAAASGQPASSGPASHSSPAADDSWSPGTFQASMLSLLLWVLAIYDGWAPAGRFSSFGPKRLPPPPADWRQRVEATLAALLEGPHGMDINQYDEQHRSALVTAVLYCPPWATHLLLRHGACPRRSTNDELVGGYLVMLSRRRPCEEQLRLLATLLEKGAALQGGEVAVLARSACGCDSAIADPDGHMRQWSALLRLLVQHGAALQSSPSLLHLALKTLLRGTRDCDDERNVFHEDLGEGSAAGPSGAPLVEAFVCALVEAGYQEAQDVASCASQLLGRMFFVIQEERDEWSDSEGPYEYRLPTVKFDLPAVQCCLRALRAACRPCTAQQAQQLLHEAIDRAVQCGVYISQRELDERCSLTVEDRKRELRCWLAAIRFAVDLGAEANGSWQGLHTLRHALACIAEHLPHRIKWRTNQPWDDLPAIVAFETVSLLVELGARATADDAANNQEPLLWIAMRLSQPDLLRLLLRAGAPAQQVFNGQTALQNLLTSDDMSSDWLLSHFVKLCCDSPQPANLEPLQLAHLWALLLEAGCPPAAPPPQMAGYLARPEMQATCGWVWVLAEGIPWAPQAHFLFPPTFRAAVRALLLVNHRGLRVSSPPSSNIITMPRQRQTGRRRRTALCTPPGDCQHWREVQLPPALVQRVLRLAAASLSAWLPPLPSCRLAEEP